MSFRNSTERGFRFPGPHFNPTQSGPLLPLHGTSVLLARKTELNQLRYIGPTANERLWCRADIGKLSLQNRDPLPPTTIPFSCTTSQECQEIDLVPMNKNMAEKSYRDNKISIWISGTLTFAKKSSLAVHSYIQEKRPVWKCFTISL